MGKRVFIISGNHDSAQRISYFSALVRSAGVYVTEAFEGRMQSVTLSDELRRADGLDAAVSAPPAGQALPAGGRKIVTYQDAMQAVLRQTPIDGKKRNILLCHQFITGAVKSDSEAYRRRAGSDRRRRCSTPLITLRWGISTGRSGCGGETLRYAGSPLKYSFSEADYGKSVPVVDVPGKGLHRRSPVPLSPMRDVRRSGGHDG